MDDFDEREEELTSLSAIYPELLRDPGNQYGAEILLAVAPSKPLLVRFIPSQSPDIGINNSYASTAANGGAYIERDIGLSHLPPLRLHVTLPATYPEEAPPTVRLTSDHGWLPNEKIRELEVEAEKLWEEYGRCQILFAYIDYLQQAAEQGFQLDQSFDGCLVLTTVHESALVTFDSEMKISIFNSGTYDCGICLEPKKGSSCYRLPRCGHVFCKQCLQDFYNNTIREGDVASVRCLSPDCGKGEVNADGRKRKRKHVRTVHPRDLLAMGIDEKMVRRYVEMKRKKKLEADKNTVYCPRNWCQGPARSPKYPPIPADLSTYATGGSLSEEDTGDEGTVEEGDAQRAPRSPSTNKRTAPLDPSDRVAICEKCSFAFCRICYRGWHGQFARCFPRDPNELSADDKASYDYILLNTSPCPSCNAPVQKTMGCNHMKCFQCDTHFCYLCGFWLDGGNPYQHFNKFGTECYQRLWELEEGDEGQAPEDGRGFRGARYWEQIAIEAAREAEAEEIAAAAQAEEDARQAHVRPNEARMVVAMAQVQLDDERLPFRGNGRRQRNPFPAQPPAHGAANAVRNYERNRGGRNGRNGGDERRAAANHDERQQAELQRFLEMAQRDEEDGWDSDELGDDDQRFQIR
ncbi:hypothetical protein LTR37_018954 [Vermiconidia calcicola]|uniref:Uncharacterized protein n=1 Tax=Vermiconidia calcicola TaxID=1690605 RepID=A0ACC3MFR3_9PEZI|nr:hypothetical protein LTR37_018954 [Vermiconidia calcicola]